MRLLSLKYSFGTGGTSTWMSIRSSNGPDILERYFRICSAVQQHLPRISPSQPQGQGFMAKLPSLRKTQIRPKNPMYPNEVQSLEDHIRSRRLDLKLRQKDVASLMQGPMNPKGSFHLRQKNRLLIDSRTVFNWENGITQPSVRFYPAIMQFLGYCPVRYPKTIGELIRLHRIHRGLSISELANILGVDPTAVGNWERDVKSPMRQSSAYVERIFRLPF